MKKYYIFLLLFLLSFIFNSNSISQQIKLSEGFESSTFPPSGWWRSSVYGSMIWERVTLPLSGVITQNAIQGTRAARINYDSPQGEDWLITKKIPNITSGDSLYFFLIKQYEDGPHPPDSLLIKVSTTDSLKNSFVNTVLKINVAGIPVGVQTWHRYSVPLSVFAGENIYIAFHHKDVNGHGCAIDSIVVYNPNSINILKISDIIPTKYYLYDNYPNPFNPSTNIKFEIPENRKWKTENGIVSLKIFNLPGKEIETLVEKQLNPGTYRVEWDASKYSSGIYFYQLSIDNVLLAVKKMILLK